MGITMRRNDLTDYSKPTVNIPRATSSHQQDRSMCIQASLDIGDFADNDTQLRHFSAFHDI